jgi:hypothetical protein
VRSIGAVSVAKILAIMYGILGFLIGAFVSLFFVFVSLVDPSARLRPAMGGGAMGLLLGFGSIILFPIFYAVIGAIFGLVSAGLYNLIASRIGGIEIEIG